MHKAAMVLISLAAIFCWSSVPALAQGGHGSGAGAHAGGMQSGGSGMHGGMMGSQSSQGPRHSEMGQPGMGRPQMGQEDRMGSREEHGRMGSRSEDGSRQGRRTASEGLAQNPKLASRLDGLFPAGTNLPETAAGFKNLGEFVSAAHVSHNLGIPLDQLRTRITSGKSLGDAIHELKPDVDAKAEVKKAREQARKDLKESGS